MEKDEPILVQPLLKVDRPAATRAVLAFVRRLGRMHADAMGREEAFDALYCRVPFPTCWCANRIPPDVVAQAEQAYRSELAVTCPAALDDELFYAGVVDVTAFWACECLRWLKQILEEDHEWGIAGVRPRILARLATFIEAAGAYERLPALQATFEQLLASLVQRWPEVQPLPVYPAFRTA